MATEYLNNLFINEILNYSMDDYSYKSCSSRETVLPPREHSSISRDDLVVRTQGCDIWQVEGTDAPNHPAIHRTVPTTKKYRA